jgi:hypothetical protein
MSIDDDIRITLERLVVPVEDPDAILNAVDRRRRIQRRRRMRGRLVIIGMPVVLLALALAWRRGNDHDAESRSARSGPAASAGTTALEACTSKSSGFSVDWKATIARFDSKGPFRLPDKPSWIPATAYCSTILLEASPALPPPGGAESVDPGVNRLLLGAEATSPDDVRFANAVLVTLYPNSIHEIFDRAGHLAGFLAPGLGEVSLDEFANADELATSPAVRAAAANSISSCTAQHCDTMTEAAITSGHTADFGSLVTP